MNRGSLQRDYVKFMREPTDYKVLTRLFKARVYPKAQINVITKGMCKLFEGYIELVSEYLPTTTSGSYPLTGGIMCFYKSMGKILMLGVTIINLTKNTKQGGLST